jgi:small subunit ribosomal protein S20
VAYHASSEKRARQTVKRTARNKHVRNTSRGYEKQIREALAEGKLAEAEQALPLFTKQIDKAVTKGVFHRKTASRYISRLSSQVAALKSRPAA